MMTMPVCMLSVIDLVFKSTHEHAVSRQLTHVHAAQFPHLRRYAVLLDQRLLHAHTQRHYRGKGSLHSITERRVSELIPVLGSQPACDANHKLGGRLPLLSARPAATPATLKRAAANFAAL